MKRSLIIFGLLSIICLVFPRFFGAYSIGTDFWETPFTTAGNNFLLVFCFILGAFYLFRSQQHAPLSIYNLSLTILFLLVLISLSVHLTALAKLPSDGFMTVGYHAVEWARYYTNRVGRLNLMLPLLFSVALLIWSYAKNPFSLLLYLPILFLPSIAVAAYQYFIDRSFLAPVSSMIFGLTAHPCAIGMSVFFLSVIAFMGIWLNFKTGRKYLYLFTFLAILGTHFLQIQTTVQIGWLLLVGLVPMMYLFAAEKTTQFSKMTKGFAKGMVVGVCLVSAALLFGKYFLSARDVLSQRLSASPLKEPADSSSTIDALKVNFQKRDSARIYYAIPAIHMFVDAPLTGWGPAGYQQNQLNYQHRYKIPLGQVHNAADYYLQLLTDFGLGGFLLVLWVHVYPLWILFKVRNRIIGINYRLCAALLWGTSAIWLLLYITGPHVDYLEVLWPFACIQACMVTIALQHGYQPRIISKKAAVAVVVVAATVYGFGCIRNAFSYNTYKYALNFSGVVSGGYRPERQDENNSWKRWIWTRATMHFDAHAESDYFMFLIGASPHNSTLPQGLTVTLRVNGRLLDSVNFINGGVKSLVYYVPGLKGSDVSFSIHANRTFIPRELGNSSDPRELGIMLLTTYNKNDDGTIKINDIPVSSTGYPFLRQHNESKRPFHFRNLMFLAAMPQEGCGFYEVETWDSRKLDGWPLDLPLRIRWTGMRASMQMPHDWKRSNGTLYVFSAHPDLSRQPVTLTLFAEDEVLKTVTFTEQGWQVVNFTSALTAGHNILTFQVNRTWNPILSGLSSDSRDLGVAIAIPPH